MNHNATYVVPGAGSMDVCTLVASELIDQDAGVAVQVHRAFTPTGQTTRCDGGAIRLRSVL